MTVKTIATAFKGKKEPSEHGLYGATHFQALHANSTLPFCTTALDSLLNPGLAMPFTLGMMFVHSFVPHPGTLIWTMPNILET